MSERELSVRQASTKKQIDAFLAKQIQALPDHAPRLKNAMQHALLVGGKRMRPLLVCLCADTLDVSPDDALAVGAAIECIHAYSLVHDDLPAMDDDDTRRGQPTCHIAFDEASAILAGDALQTLAFDILTTQLSIHCTCEQRLALIRATAIAAGYKGMCGGQAMDLAATGHTISEPTLKQLHQLKTGALLRLCVEAAIILAESLSVESHTALLAYADNIGMAFQVRDDIIDVTESSETLGKPSGSDEKLHKSTFVSLLGLDGAQQALKNYHTQALQALDTLPYNTDLLRQFADLMTQRKY
ncbi:polyprenyl synthetase family protein [Alteromonas oceanisediminis]|uniref:polyprenyl synthetase family protein n=1 Tax=Alteromonas oceanisediminis TaxID=2836180 RepID=UPI001BD96BF1|nr:farnesyl diphosphate synthase [Alteromonas oceanisediminis]MBT0585823.1 polyprenyl synthetase family protein [Alteromonas oceanisediminis]